MLTELRIRDFAIIDDLTLPLAPGFNVLSGETGAGKSIIVGALGLLLGERGSADLVRAGAGRAVVEGAFEIDDEPALAAGLDARGVEAPDGVIILKREVAAGGRSRAWANGSPVTAAVLSGIGRALVNLHGQHEAQTLLDADAQREVLDAFAGAEDDAAAVRGRHEEVAGLRRAIADLSRRRAEAERRADYLRHVVREIEEARLADGEDTRLEEEARRLEHADELRGLASGVADAVTGDEASALRRLGQLQRSLDAVIRIDPAASRLQELYDTAYYALEELGRELADYAAAVDLDPERLEEVRRRRDLLFRLTRKYGATVADMLATLRDARAELELADAGGLDLAELERRRNETEGALTLAADALSARRAAAAAKLGRAVGALLPALGMPDGRFFAELIPRDTIGAAGAEDVEFRVALNPGHPPRPLARVASGGELSRVMLAIKTILARVDRIPTLVFDEVDSGIGGKVGQMVGDTLRRVAAHHQVFAITHLPQIAARAHAHIRVRKDARGGVTTAGVSVLEGDERVIELARMLGGDPDSEVSRAHARELLGESAVAGTERVQGSGFRVQKSKAAGFGVQGSVEQGVSRGGKKRGDARQ